MINLEFFTCCSALKDCCFLYIFAPRTSLACAATDDVVPKVLLIVKCCLDKHIPQVVWSFVGNNWPVLEYFLQSLFAFKCWPMLVYDVTKIAK